MFHNHTQASKINIYNILTMFEIYLHFPAFFILLTLMEFPTVGKETSLTLRAYSAISIRVMKMKYSIHAFTTVFSIKLKFLLLNFRYQKSYGRFSLEHFFSPKESERPKKLEKNSNFRVFQLV